MRGRAAGRVFGYCRVSSAKQDRDGTSLEGQEQAIGRWIRSEGLPTATRIAVEVESGSAEKTEARVEQLSLLRDARPGDTIVVAAVDRWSRDIVHAVSTVRALVAKGVRWYAIREALDAATREGEDRLGLMAWVADSERKRIRERTLGRWRELSDAGLYVRGRPPVGYRVEERRLVPNEDAAIVRAIFERCAAGEGLAQIAKTLALPSGYLGQAGRRRWDKTGLARALRNRMYLGELPRSDGTWHPAHEALVDRDLWERALTALEGRRRQGRAPGEGASAARLLRGIGRCAKCGRRIAVVLGRRRARDGVVAQSYICTGHIAGQCEARYVHAERLDDLVSKALLARLVELRHELAAAPADTPAARAPIDHGADLSRLRTQRERLISLAVDGTITKDDLKTRLLKIDREVGRLEQAQAAERRAAAAEKAARKPETRRELLADVERLQRMWSAASPAHRRRTLALLAERVEVRAATKARVHQVFAPTIRWKPLPALIADR